MKELPLHKACRVPVTVVEHKVYLVEIHASKETTAADMERIAVRKLGDVDQDAEIVMVFDQYVIDFCDQCGRPVLEGSEDEFNESDKGEWKCKDHE